MNAFRLMLAPLENMSSNAFRTICHRHGADLTFTEMVRVGALARGNASTWSRLEFRDATPSVIQLLGSREDHLAGFLDRFEPGAGFSGFNLNLGCSSPEITRLGQGCAMVRKISKTRRLVDMIKDRGYAASVKMRLGMNQQDKDHRVYLKIIESAGADFFVVHARHGLETYADPADFSVYEECVRTGMPVIANGDISTGEQIARLRDLGLAGAMIGRAAVTDPCIFARLRGLPAFSIESVREEYVKLSQAYEEPQRYRNNILRFLGKSDGRMSEKLDEKPDVG
jgi:tRNA-dihydrouridine synthase B